MKLRRHALGALLTACSTVSMSRVAQSRFGALGAHWGALKNEPDYFKAFGVGATGQFVAFQLYLRGDAGKHGLDELVDEPGGCLTTPPAPSAGAFSDTQDVASFSIERDREPSHTVITCTDAAGQWRDTCRRVLGAR